jgi:hypothetical protein
MMVAIFMEVKCNISIYTEAKSPHITKDQTFIGICWMFVLDS